MSKIDDQIKALLIKKKKVDYIGYIADLLKNDTKCIDYKEVQKEIVSQIEPFLLELMDAIEKDVEVQIGSKSTDLTVDQQKALVELADKVIAVKNNPKPDVPKRDTPFNSDSDPVSAPLKKEAEYSITEKMDFAMNNRHLGGKKVQVQNDTNSTVTGTVVGLDVPHVIVQTDQGPRIKVPPEKVMMV